MGSTMPSNTTLLSNRNYDLVKYTATLILPAIGALYFALAQIWGFPRADDVVGTIAALNVFAGVVLAVAARVYNLSGAKYDGTFRVEETDEGSSFRMTDVDQNALFDKSELTFRIVRPKG